MEPNAKSWIFSMMESLPSDDFVMVLVTLRAIWTARRKAIYEGQFQSPLSTHFLVKKFLDDLSLIPRPPIVVTQVPAPRTSCPRWIPPSDGLIKANVDGVKSRSLSTGSAAVVLRNGDGIYLGSSVMVFSGVADPPTLEALACREALALATDLSIRRMAVVLIANKWFRILLMEPVDNMLRLFRRSRRTYLFVRR
jgi:hypothetical protein